VRELRIDGKAFTVNQTGRDARLDHPPSVPDQSTADPWANSEAQVRCEARTDRDRSRQIESRIDLPYQMIFGSRLAKVKLVEQLTLVNLPTARSWIDLAEIRVTTTESRFATSLN
jgi:hypothetical protein